MEPAQLFEYHKNNKFKTAKLCPDRVLNNMIINKLADEGLVTSELLSFKITLFVMNNVVLRTFF